MKVRDLMAHTVVTLPPDAPLCEAAALMKRHNIGALPVTENGKPVGIVTDRDIALRYADAPGFALCVRDAATRATVCISPDHSVTEAARRMARYRVHRLPVCENGTVVGMLALSDIARASGCFSEAASAFCDICKEGR